MPRGLTYTRIEDAPADDREIARMTAWGMTPEQIAAGIRARGPGNMGSDITVQRVKRIQEYPVIRDHVIWLEIQAKAQQYERMDTLRDIMTSGLEEMKDRMTDTDRRGSMPLADLIKAMTFAGDRYPDGSMAKITKKESKEEIRVYAGDLINQLKERANEVDRQRRLEAVEVVAEPVAVEDEPVVLMEDEEGDLKEAPNE